ncbi:serine hydrolase domain-containing protein [Longispora albida]|uniref:serine hydrolase domain-containing protein n=1 Tax=Longispora albida TaxID=203523 RepID=UPI00035CE391|nr:serine hydrolase domain-containing protein [Longispora albida]
MRLDELLSEHPRHTALSIGVLDHGERRTAGHPGQLYRIASISKVFTSLALAVAVERGELKLTDPVAGYLPFAVPEHEGQPVELWHLASHSSGLDHLTYTGWSPDETLDEFGAGIAGMGFQRPPGTGYEYSNLGASLLANALACAAGTDFGSLVAERVCQPLGLTDTVLDPSPEQAARVLPGHNEDGNPTPTPLYPLHAGSGGFYSTVDDLLTLLAAHFTPGPLTGALELAAQQRFDRGDGGFMGLGWHLDGVPGSAEPARWHNGSLPGYRSYAGYVPGTGCAVVVLTDTAISVDPIAQEILPALV